MERVAVDLHVENFIQMCRPQDGGAVLTRGDHGHPEAAIAELVYESNASFVRLNPSFRNHPVDQVVFPVPKSDHGFGMRGVVQVSLGQMNIA